jgi:hypothetical protein
MPFRTSLYADGAVIFINTAREEILAVTEMLNVFAEATGLHTSFEKSSITQVRCDGLDLEDIAACFGCQIACFPCKYLGMPLSNSRLKKVDLQDAFDKLAAKLKSWKHLHLRLGYCLILVQHVLSAMAVFQMLAIDLLVWLKKKIDKLEGDLSPHQVWRA